MSDDFIEKPSCKILYRQSSLETRLSPIHLSEKSSSESEDEGEKNEKVTPKIVEYKSKLPKDSDSANNQEAQLNFSNQFKDELNQKLNKSLQKKDGTQLITSNNVFSGENRKEKMSEEIKNAQPDTTKEDISIVGTLKGKIFL